MRLSICGSKRSVIVVDSRTVCRWIEAFINRGSSAWFAQNLASASSSSNSGITSHESTVFKAKQGWKDESDRVQSISAFLRS